MSPGGRVQSRSRSAGPPRHRDHEHRRDLHARDPVGEETRRDRHRERQAAGRKRLDQRERRDRYRDHLSPEADRAKRLASEPGAVADRASQRRHQAALEAAVSPRCWSRKPRSTNAAEPSASSRPPSSWLTSRPAPREPASPTTAAPPSCRRRSLNPVRRQRLGHDGGDGDGGGGGRRRDQRERAPQLSAAVTPEAGGIGITPGVRSVASPSRPAAASTRERSGESQRHWR